jgi:Domain of unknown function (DUF4191)
MAKAQQPQKVGLRERGRQIQMVFSYTAKRDKLFLPVVIAVATVPLLLVVLLALIGAGWLWIPVGVLGSLLGVLIVLNLRANKARMNELKGQPGGAASVVQSMRGDWRVTPAVASTTQFDVVHLVIGKPGVILLGEGHPARVRGLITAEKRRLAKVIGTAELRDYTVGDRDGEVPLAKLRMTLMKLPRTLSGRDVNALDKRLTALTSRPQLPKGAIPKNLRPPKGARAARGR